MKAVLLLLLTIVLAGCTSGTLSTRDSGVGYAMSAQQAKEIIDGAMLTYLSHDRINPHPQGMAAIASSGYIRSLMDTTTINSVAIPVQGVSAQGKREPGYAFTVRYAGTIFFPQTPKRIFDEIVSRAESHGGQLTVK